MKEDYLHIAAPIFNIQSYSIHDGPGIRVTVFIKGCPLQCIWCANPESNLVKPQLMTYQSKCTGCGRCIFACPRRAISLAADNGKVYAVTDRKVCRDCGECVPACPADAREIAGKEMTVREVLGIILKEKLFLEASGGGMTLSGGEALMHPEFAEALFFASQQEGLHTAVESCGFAGRETIDRVFKYVNLALLDIKHMDSSVHKELTGVSNEPILENIRYVYHVLKKEVTIRIPVIPGYNDSTENISATAKFVHDELGPDVGINLLPYHRMGESKKLSLGKTADLFIMVPADEQMQGLKTLVNAYGIQAQIGG